jgi:hypothetical protein
VLERLPDSAPTRRIVDQTTSVGDTRCSTVGTYQHYLPAAYLGRFSADTKKAARDRPLWVRSLAAPRPHIAAASKVGGEVGLYDVKDDSLVQRV